MWTLTSSLGPLVRPKVSIFPASGWPSELPVSCTPAGRRDWGVGSTERRKSRPSSQYWRLGLATAGDERVRAAAAAPRRASHCRTLEFWGGVTHCSLTSCASSPSPVASGSLQGQRLAWLSRSSCSAMVHHGRISGLHGCVSWSSWFYGPPWPDLGTPGPRPRVQGGAGQLQSQRLA
jgi:hypothetical protein